MKTLIIGLYILALGLVLVSCVHTTQLAKIDAVEGEGEVLCCCTTISGGTCCAYMPFCTSFIPGCQCR